MLGLKRQDWAVKHTIELRRGFGARDRAENAAIAKKGRPDRRPAGRRNEQPTGGRAGLFLQRNAYGSVGAALAIDFRESVTIRSDPLLRRVHRIRPVKALRYSRLRSDSEVEVNKDQPAGFSLVELRRSS